jgi:restriction endonuclease S subunit
LNPNAKLKPSGIEWLADIPAHWNAKRFGYLFRFYSGGTPSTAENSLWDGDIPWVSSKDMKSTVINDTQDHISEEAVRVSATCKLPSGTLLMVNRSGILRHSLPVAVTTREMAINQDIRGCVPLGSVNATFVAYLLQGNEGPLLTLWRQQGATVESLNFESVKLTRILLPPAPEQAAIVEFLDAETAKIDRLVEKVKAAIEKLLEYRTALITAAVTGKIDVRNAS